MSYRPDEKEWMAYLYGEMADEDKQKMDAYLLQNPAAHQELDQFRKLRRMLSKAEDKEVIAPPIFIGENSGRGSQRYLWNAPYFKMIASIAASLLLIILAGTLAGTQIRISDNEIRLTFGGTPVASPTPSRETTPALSGVQVQEMINASLENNNELMEASLKETQALFDASIRKNLAISSGKIDRLVREASSASQQQISQFVDGIRTENMQQVKDYFQLTSTEQKQYIENLLVDFSKYLQQQRNNDLRLMQTRMNSIEQNTDIFKQETEQILSSIITSVGHPDSGETKN